MTFKDCINTQSIKAYVDQAIADIPIPTGFGWDPLTIDNIRDYLRNMNGMTVVTNDMIVTIPIYRTVDNVETKFGVCQAFIKAGEQFRIPYFGSNVYFDLSPFSMEYTDCYIWYGLGNFIVACTVYYMTQNSNTKDIEITSQSVTVTMKNDLSGFVNPEQPR